MITVTYDHEDEDEIGFTYPIVDICFEHDQINFCPETLRSSAEWQNLLNSIRTNTKYCVESFGTNSNYSVCYDGTILTLSVAAHGSGCVGSLTVTIPLTEYNLDLIEKIRNVAQCVENNIEYIC